MKRYIFKLLSIIALFLVLTTCNDSLSIAPTSKFTDQNYWTSVGKAKMVLNTAYGQMANNGYYFYNSGLSDNAYIGRGDPYNTSTITQGNQNPSTPRFENEWSSRYAGIKTCNVFLENIDKVPDMAKSIKAGMKAQARFIRAYQYFMLTTWFGDVPYFTDDISVAKSKAIKQTSHEAIVDSIHATLRNIQSELPIKGEYSSKNSGRITKGAAIALNARVYLYNNNWKGVINSTKKLINSGNYGLFPSYRKLFLPKNEYNKEIILAFQYTPGKVTHNEMFDLAPLSVGARVNAMAPTQELVNAYPMMNGKPIFAKGSGYDPAHPFKNRDPRLDATIIYHLSKVQDRDGTYHTVYIKPNSAPNETLARDEYQGKGSNSTSTGYYQRKYYNPNVPANFNSGLNLIVIRYADVLLMYAEAKNALGQMNEQVWNKTIRVLRERAGLNKSALNYNNSWSQNKLRKIIHRERRVETAFENLRIFDLRRWKDEKALSGKLHGAPYGSPADNIGLILTTRQFNPSRDYLWPIPQQELDLNDNLTQNPGY